jgi:hypothetical protein
VGRRDGAPGEFRPWSWGTRSGRENGRCLWQGLLRASVRVGGVAGLRREVFEDEPDDPRRFLLEAHCRWDRPSGATSSRLSPGGEACKEKGEEKQDRDPSGVELSHSDSFPRRIALGGHHGALGFAAWKDGALVPESRLCSGKNCVSAYRQTARGSESSEPELRRANRQAGVQYSNG